MAASCRLPSPQASYAESHRTTTSCDALIEAGVDEDRRWLQPSRARINDVRDTMGRIPHLVAPSATRSVLGMGATIESTVLIERRAEEVYRFFLDLDENARQVDPELLSVVRSPDGPTRAGTTFRFRQRFLGKPRETKTRYTALDPNRRIEFETALGPIRPTAILTFERAGNGTRVNLRANPNPVGPVKLLSPLIKRIGRREWDDRLQRVKSVLESARPEHRSES